MSDENNTQQNIEKNSNHGGARPGAGMPKGKVLPKTVERKRELAEIRKKIRKNADRLINAQMQLALGCSFLYKLVDKGTGKKEFVIVQDKEEILRYLNREFENTDIYYYIGTDKPDNKAISNLLDRAYGKPTQPVDGNINMTKDYDQLTTEQLDQQINALTELAEAKGVEDGEIEEDRG